jgi:hypothetical protein
MHGRCAGTPLRCAHWQRSLNECRHERRRLGPRYHGPARLPAPREHLLWGQPMAASDLGNNRARRQRLLDNPRLVIRGEPATSPCPRDHLQPTHSRLRLKRMVKRRHKPISDSEITTLAHRSRQMKVRSEQRLPRFRPAKAWYSPSANDSARSMICGALYSRALPCLHPGHPGAVAIAHNRRCRARVIIAPGGISCLTR